MLRNTSAIAEIRWLDGVNKSGEEIPAFAAVQPIATDNDFESVRLLKPTDDNQHVILVGPMPIENDKVGAVTNDMPWWALYDPADGNPMPGEEYGAQADSFRLKFGNTGFKVWEVDVENERILVARTGGGGGGGGTLIVEEVDGDPSVSNVTKIKFDQADGFKVTDEGDGVARIDLSGLGALTVKEEDGTPTVTNVHTIILASPNLSVTQVSAGVAKIDTVGYTGDYVTEVICNANGTITVTKRTMIKGVGK